MNVPEAIESLRASCDGVGTAMVECVRCLRPDSEVRPGVPVTEFGEGHQVVVGCLLHLRDTLLFANHLSYIYI